MNEWIGKQLGQYEIIAEIGRGGMAVVYKAWQPALGRHVAIKVLAPQLAADQAFVARFRREAKSAAQLNHPNIVTIHDVGQEGQTHFIVMAYLDGQSLYNLLKATGPLPLARAVHITAQIASALDYAHQRGYVHRDIKPANIVVRPDDHATLTDFGIVKAASGTSLTQTGTMVGTPQYMAPEQIQGAQVDHRADVYSLGIVCYEMLTGAPPFIGDTAAVLYAQAHKPPPPLQLPDLPAFVQGVLDQALTKDPDQRFASAGAMAADLQATSLIETLPGGTHAATPTAPAGVASVPAPESTASTAAALAPASAPQRVTPATPLPQEPLSPPPSAPFATPAPASRPITRRRAPGLRAWALLGSGVALLVVAAVLAIILLGGGREGTTGQSTPTRTRSSQSTTVARATDTSPPTVTSKPVVQTPPPTHTPKLTPAPSSLRLAFASGSPGDADIYVMDANGNDLRRLAGSQDDEAEPDWSRNGETIVYQSDQAGNYDIWRVDADGQSQRALTTNPVDEREPDWSPDGRHIVYRRGGQPNGDGELWVMDADGGNQSRLGGQQVLGRAPAWSPDGRHVVYMSERDGTWNIYLYDVSDADTRRLTDCDAHCRFPGWSPDGAFIMFHSTRSASSFTPVQIWRLRVDGSGSPTRLVDGDNPGRAVWSSQGLIAFNSDAGIEIIKADGTDRRALPKGEDGWAPDWSR